MLTYVAIGVAITCFVLYTLDRKSKEEPVEWDVALKLSSLGAVLSGGVAYAVSNPNAMVSMAKDIVPEIPIAQDMFVGTPTF